VDDPLLQVAVARDAIRDVVDDLEAWLIEAGGKESFGEGHPHAVGEALPQRPGRRFDARCPAVLGMTRRQAVERSMAFELLERHVVPAQMEDGVQQSRAVPGGLDVAVSVGPTRIGRVMPQKPRPQHGGDVGHAERHPRMAAA
jgi:hypothetical protein